MPRPQDMSLDDKREAMVLRIQRLYPPKMYKGELEITHGTSGGDPFVELARNHLAHLARDLFAIALQLDLLLEPTHEGSARARVYYGHGALSLSAIDEEGA